jgi:hypothetical protein
MAVVLMWAGRLLWPVAVTVRAASSVLSGSTSAFSGAQLSKFQSLMPPWVEREVVASSLLDAGGAWRWLSKGETLGQGM